METIRKLTTVEKQEVDNYFKEQLKKIIFSKNCSAPKENLEGGELAIAITIDSFPKHCHEFILNKPKEN